MRQQQLEVAIKYALGYARVAYEVHPSVELRIAIEELEKAVSKG